LRKRFGYAF